jgi:hypothetical protein
MKLQWNKIPLQMVILDHFNVAGHQVSGTENIVALEVIQKCFSI